MIYISKNGGTIKIVNEDGFEFTYLITTLPARLFEYNAGDTVDIHILDFIRNNHPIAQITMGGVVPANKTQFYTQVAAVFPDPETAGGTGLTTVAVDNITIQGNGDDVPIGVIQDATQRFTSDTEMNDKQDVDPNITALAGLTPLNDDIIQRKAGAWTNRTPAELKADLLLSKDDIGLGSVDNTSDSAKNSAPVALTNKDLTSGTNVFPASLVTLTGNQVLTNKTLTSPSITAPTGIVKGDVGLGNVDNTSDASKPVSTAQATAIGLKQNLLGFTPENNANKATGFGTVNNTLYPTVQAVKTYADALLIGLVNDRGNYDASVNTFPASGGSGTAGAILKGDLWTVSVAGTLGGHAVTVGDIVRALVDTPGQTDANWAITENNFGYVAENSANKDTDGTLGANSDTKYASQKATKTYADTKEALANKDIDATLAANSDTKYASQKAVKSYIDTGLSGKQSSLGFTPVPNTRTVNSHPLSADISITKSDVGLGNVDNTSDVTKNGATATLTNKTLTSPVINSPTGIVKGDVGLGNVDNTSDANKPVSTLQAAADTAAIAAAAAYADSLVVGLWDDRGSFDASGGAYPSTGGSGSAGAIKKGDIWTISVAGTLPSGEPVGIGHTVRAIADTPGQTPANWALGGNNLGYVPLNAASNFSDVPDKPQAIVNLGLGTLATQNGTFSGTSSGNNTGDQDLSGLLTKAGNLDELDDPDEARVNLGVDGRKIVDDTNYTILPSDKTVAIIAITASRVITMPAANSVNPGYELITIDESGSVSGTITVTFNRAGSDTLNGATSVVMTTAYGFRRWISNGVDKWIYASGVSNPETIGGGRVAVANTDYTILSSDRYIAYTSITATRTATLPLANSLPAGATIVVGDESGNVTTTNKITVARAGSDTINSGTTENITSAFGFRVFRTDGVSKWTHDASTVRANNTVVLTNKDLTAATNTFPVTTISGTAVNLGDTIDLRARTAAVSGSDVATTLATAVDITGLSKSVAAGKKYRVTAVLYTSCSGTGGMKFGFNGPSGTTMPAGQWTGSGTAANSSKVVRAASAVGSLSGAVFNAFASTGGMATLVGYITTTNAGTFQLQFASATASETSTIVIGSTMDLAELI